MLKALCRSLDGLIRSEGWHHRKQEACSSSRWRILLDRASCLADFVQLSLRLQCSAAVQGVVMATAFERFDLDGDGPLLEKDFREMVYTVSVRKQ